MIFTTIVQQVRDKYSGLSFDELVQIAQTSNMTDLHFILAQPELSEDFKTWLEDRGGNTGEVEEADATLFLEEQEMFLTYQEE